MNFDKYTQTSANVINASSSLARTYENSQIEVEHLIYSMLDNKTLIYEILEKCNIDTNGLKLSLLNTIKNMPKVSGQSEVYPSNNLVKLFNLAENIAKNMQDEYVSIEHLFLASFDCLGDNLSRIYREYTITKDKFVKELAKVRGGAKVTTDNPEDTYNVLV